MQKTNNETIMESNTFCIALFSRVFRGLTPHQVNAQLPILLPLGFFTHMWIRFSSVEKLRIEVHFSLEITEKIYKKTEQDCSSLKIQVLLSNWKVKERNKNKFRKGKHETRGKLSVIIHIVY